jgi:hypothetical protein
MAARGLNATDKPMAENMRMSSSLRGMREREAQRNPDNVVGLSFPSASIRSRAFLRALIRRLQASGTT